MGKSGVLLVNVGSPHSATTQHVRRFLREFLMDPRVLDLPWPVRFWLVHCIILPLRTRKAAEAYRKIWTSDGAPLIAASEKLKAVLEDRLKLRVTLAMRYGRPGIPEAIVGLASAGVTKLVAMPLFPHYAMSSYETAVVRVKQLAQRLAPAMHLIVQPPFYAHPEYISALVASAQNYLQADHDWLLFSFHSLPERHLRRTDPTHQHCLARPDCCVTPSPAHATCYRHQCIQTANAFAKLAGLDHRRCSVAFQSRFGAGHWLGPDTAKELRRLAMNGVRKVAVICPSFVADCLETLEEIGMRARAEFLVAGGSEFTLIPCLNNHPQWVGALEKMINQTLAGDSSA